MPLLDEIRSAVTALAELNKLKSSLCHSFALNGGTWQEMAFVDKNEAVHLCMDCEKVGLLDAERIVTSYLHSQRIREV